MRRIALAGAVLLAAVLGRAPAVVAQAQTDAGAEAQERQFAEGLRREDPAEADRYVALRDARNAAIAELRQAEIQYNAAGSELRFAVRPKLRQAQHKYAEASLALLDFLDTRDRRALAKYQDAIERINRVLDEHQRTRAELEKLLEGN